jgi:hypothetical protein
MVRTSRKPSNSLMMKAQTGTASSTQDPKKSLIVSLASEVVDRTSIFGRKKGLEPFFLFLLILFPLSNIYPQ